MDRPVHTPTARGMDYTRDDFAHSPMLVFYEVTRACNLICKHCRADAQKKSHPEELTPEQSLALIDQLATFPKKPLLVLTGGDPMKRKDVFDIVRHARSRGMMVAMTPSATALVTRERIDQLAAAGLHRLAVSIDGANAASHDAFRGVPGSFQRTLDIIAHAHAAGIPIQINTTIARHNVGELDAMADLLDALPVMLWSVFFLIPTGRGLADQRLSGEEIEAVFAKLGEQIPRRKYAIKTTEAPHYRRFLAEQEKARLPKPAHPHGAKKHHGPPPKVDASKLPPHLIGTNDGKGVMFVSHIGELFPSGFMPIHCGRFPQDSVVDAYQKHELFVQLRNGDLLNGKCGHCPYRDICGGSRARAYAMTGDPLGAEPDCTYGAEHYARFLAMQAAASPNPTQEKLACST